MPNKLTNLTLAATFDIHLDDEYLELDLPHLMEVVSKCFKLNRDGRRSLEVRHQYLDEGERLQKKQDSLLNKYFVSGTDAVLAANKKIALTNKATTKALADLESDADTIEQLGALASALDKVLDIIT